VGTVSEVKKIAGIDDSGLAENVKQIAQSLRQVDLSVFKSPWNVHYASFEPERKFSDLCLKMRTCLTRS